MQIHFRRPYNSCILWKEVQLRLNDIRKNSNAKSFSVMKKENPSRNLVKRFILHRARFTIGVSYSVLFRRRSHTYTPKEFDVLSRKLEKMEHESMQIFWPKLRFRLEAILSRFHFRYSSYDVSITMQSRVPVSWKQSVIKYRRFSGGSIRFSCTICFHSS